MDQNEKGLNERAYELISAMGKERHLEAASKLLTEPRRGEVLVQILKGFIADGDLKNAEKTAAAIGRTLTTDEHELILEQQIAKASYFFASDTVKRLERKLTKEELVRLLENMGKDASEAKSVVVNLILE